MALAPSRYELLDRIAVGGMAEVFRAKAFGAHGFEKTLAIKRILPELAKDPEFEERFIAEAKLAVGLSHANVVQVLDFGRFAGTLFIAMELVSGLDLAALLKFYSDKDERVPIPAAFQISIEIIRGLSFAHQNDVVHRDVSPSNILLSKAGEVKIADFGIAVAMREELGVDEGRIMGKWRYMSPEQTRGKKLNESSDLFSAAVVIHEIFSGQKLFPGTDSKDIIENIHCMPIPRLSELRAGVPEALDEVLAGALERDMGKRHASGGDLLRALTEASYKSSIVATSIDVADAVAEAQEAGVEGASVKPVPGMDDLIREQLAGANQFRPSERRTAVVPGDIGLASTQVQAELDGGTMVKSGVDGRGVTIWELDRETIAAVPSAKRKAEEAEAGDARDDVETEGGGRYHEDEPGHPGLRRGVIYSALAFSSLMAIMIYFVSSGPNGKSATASSFDAAVTEPALQEESLLIDSVPQGATIFLNGERLDTLTPTRKSFPPGVEIESRLVLDGYKEAIYTHVLTAGSGTTHYLPRLIAYSSTLIVNTSPEGATIVLDGQERGTTPLVLTDLRPGKARKLELRLKDHKTYESEVDLVRDQQTKVDQILKSTLVYGQIRIVVSNSWADISAGGKRLGRTGKKIRLRVGKHKLQLHNPISGKKKSVVVEVFADRIENYDYAL